MPRGDRTGPQGVGPMSGRAAGYCAGYDMPGYANADPGRAYGRGMAWGRGGRGRGGRGAGGGGWGYARQAQPAPADAPVAPPPPPAPAQEKTFLEREISGLKAELSYLEERLKGLEQAKEE